MFNRLEGSTILEESENAELIENDGKELAVKDFTLVHKNTSKRSVDEAELEEEDSPLDSPGSKRSRLL